MASHPTPITISTPADGIESKTQIFTVTPTAGTGENPTPITPSTPSQISTPIPNPTAESTSVPIPPAIPPTPLSPLHTAPTPVATNTPQPSAPNTPSPTATLTSGFNPFGEDRNCADFADWSTAQSFFIAAGGPSDDRHQLDGDNDGTACESLPGAP